MKNKIFIILLGFFILITCEKESEEDAHPCPELEMDCYLTNVSSDEGDQVSYFYDEYDRVNLIKDHIYWELKRHNGDYRMKGCFYLVLIVAFLMYYQENPVFVVVILTIGFGGYLLFKRKRSTNGNMRAGFFSGRPVGGNNNMTDIMTLLLIQQMYSQPENTHTSNTVSEEHAQIEKTQKEILELLDED